jgi:hypothetical protein
MSTPSSWIYSLNADGTPDARLGPAVLVRLNLGICYADDIPDGMPLDRLAVVPSDSNLDVILPLTMLRPPKSGEPNVAWFEMPAAPAGTPVHLDDFTGVGNPTQAMRRAKRILDGTYHKPDGAHFVQPMGIWCTWFGIFC